MNTLRNTRTPVLGALAVALLLACGCTANSSEVQQTPTPSPPSPSAPTTPTPAEHALVLVRKACNNFGKATHDPGGNSSEDIKARANLFSSRALALVGQAAQLDPRWLTLSADMNTYVKKSEQWTRYIHTYGVTNQRALDLLTEATTGSSHANKTCARV